jgi:hypothetical protein
MAGKVGQSMVLHNRDHQGITGKQAMLTTPIRCDRYLRTCEGKQLQPDHRQFVDRLTMSGEVSNLRVLVPQSASNGSCGPAESLRRFIGHQSMCHFT